jgi:uncharacterized LabA/DUF88 family protein
MSRLIAYIDGFNLYHAVHALRKPHLKWLDLWSLSQSFARAGETVAAVNYFSAYATWLPEAHVRHREYVKALQHHGVTCILGHFKSKQQKCKACGAEWTSHEEKETDVHIAARLVADAYEDRFDRALLITADSDLAPALNIVAAAFPGKQLFVAAPPGRFNHARSLNTKMVITPGRLAKCLLPESSTGAAGIALFQRPRSYAPPV